MNATLRVYFNGHQRVSAPPQKARHYERNAINDGTSALALRASACPSIPHAYPSSESGTRSAEHPLEPGTGTSPHCCMTTHPFNCDRNGTHATVGTHMVFRSRTSLPSVMQGARMLTTINRCPLTITTQLPDTIQRLNSNCLRKYTMNPAGRSCVLITAVAAFTITANAQQPPDVVQSDGNDSTAMGTNALLSAEGAYGDTAAGFSALYFNTSGSNNTATGTYALYLNTIGSYNTASGNSALSSNTTGNGNTAFGAITLVNNTTGFYNTATGSYVLTYSTGNYNTATGANALFANTTGSNNTALGYRTLANNAGGAKISIASMGKDIERLQRLRPVTFHLKTDPRGAIQYGLIAEEVAKVYPELVIHDQSGRINGIRYEELAPMLLNEVQQQHQQLMQQQQALAEVGQLKQQMAELEQANESMRMANQTLQASIAKLLTKDEQIASR
jgi:hypothetical protein